MVRIIVTSLCFIFIWSIVGLSAYGLNKLENNIKQERIKNEIR